MAASRKASYLARLLRKKGKNLALYETIIAKREDDSVTARCVTSVPVNVNVTRVGIDADTRHQGVAEICEGVAGNYDSMPVKLQ
jgi:hypothetical protein